MILMTFFAMSASIFWLSRGPDLLGVTQQTANEDHHIFTEPQLCTRLWVLMGGYAAERLVLGSVSTEAENDLKEATRLATKMVAHYGMSQGLGPVYYNHKSEHPSLGKRMVTDGGSSDRRTHRYRSGLTQSELLDPSLWQRVAKSY